MGENVRQPISGKLSHNTRLPRRMQTSSSVLQAVTEGLGKVLEAVATATVVIGLVQQHHTKVIQPQVQASPGEAAACTSGLTVLIKATEERVLAALQAALNAFSGNIETVCSASSTDSCRRCSDNLPLRACMSCCMTSTKSAVLPVSKQHYSCMTFIL